MADYLIKRKSPRRRLSRIAGVLHHGEFLTSQIVEIGEGGVFVSTSKALSSGDSVVVTFSVEGSPMVSARAEVRYEVEVPGTGRPGYGLQFMNLELGYKRLIRRYVSRKTIEEANADKEQENSQKKIHAFSFDQEGNAKPTVM